MKDTLQINVLHCSRCGGEHAQLTVKRLGQPITFRDMGLPYRLTHWALCPTNGEPILVGPAPEPQKLKQARILA